MRYYRCTIDILIDFKVFVMRFANAEEADYLPQEYRINPHDFNEHNLGKLITLIRKNASETEIDAFLRHKLYKDNKNVELSKRLP